MLDPIDELQRQAFKSLHNEGVLFSKLDKILEGIDKDEGEDGWWPTSDGVEFGKRKKHEIFMAIKGFIETTRP